MSEHEIIDLHTLLSYTPIQDWASIYHRIQLYPHEAEKRYYRNQSPLHLALQVRERRKDRGHSKRFKSERSALEIQRIHVLQALVHADPPSILCRDAEGRTPLHTACNAGRSREILYWLLEEEKRLRPLDSKERPSSDIDDNLEGTIMNSTLPTHPPGGALPLHSIASCPVFDDTPLNYNHHNGDGDQSIQPGGKTHLNCPCSQYVLPSPLTCNYPFHCIMTSGLLSAYASTTIILQANPNAIWERNCEGEIPLHVAASWGNVGSVLSLLIAAGKVAKAKVNAAASASEVSLNGGSTPTDGTKTQLSMHPFHQNTMRMAQTRLVGCEVPSMPFFPGTSTLDPHSAAAAALTPDSSGKTPLDRACERVCALCIHEREVLATSHQPFYHAPTPTYTREDVSVTHSTSNCTDARIDRTHGNVDIVHTPAVGNQGTQEQSADNMINDENDPFRGSGRPRRNARRSNASNRGGISNEGRRSLLRSSITGSSRRIPGCGSSFRSSFSSSILGGAGAFDVDPSHLNNSSSSVLRASFVSPRRRPVDPILGLETLDKDGEEEFLKVEILAMAACEHVDSVNKIRARTNEQTPSDAFKLVHAVVNLGCPPEIVWLAAAKYPHHLGMKDQWGRVPLFIACERLGIALVRNRKRYLEKRCYTSCLSHSLHPSDKALKGDREQDLRTAATAGEHFAVSTHTSHAQENRHPSAPLSLLSNSFPFSRETSSTISHKTDMGTSHDTPPPSDETSISLSVNIDTPPSIFPANIISTHHEIINILLHSKPEMASVPNEQGRLALHVLLEAGLLFMDDDALLSCESTRNSHIGNNDENHHTNPMHKFRAIKALLDAHPRSLETRDRKTGLFPFMLAAASKSLPDLSNSVCTDCAKQCAYQGLEKACTKQLETVYRLLLDAPTAISFCLQKNSEVEEN